MKSFNTFSRCETLFYGLHVDTTDVMLTDVKRLEDLLYLSNIGYSIVIVGGKVTLKGTLEAVARLIKDEINEELVDSNEGLKNFVNYNFPDTELYILEIKNVIEAVRREKIWAITFQDIFDFILERWSLDSWENEQFNIGKKEYVAESKFPEKTDHLVII